MSEQKRVLVIGGGSIGERHIRCFQQTRRADVSLCEINDQVRNRIAAAYGLSSTFRDLKETSDIEFDAAVICTPAHLHVPMATELAERQVDLLIEKPLSTSLTGIDNLYAAVEASGTAVAVAYVNRANPILLDLKRALDSGEFGAPVEIIAVSGQHFPFYRPAYREIYYRDRQTGGGAIQDALTHILNLAEWLVGPITELTADADHLVLEGVEVEDTVHVLARHGNILANYSLNQHQAPNETTITIVCERGTLRFETHESRWRWQTKPDAAWTDVCHRPLERDELFVSQANAFLDVVERRCEPLCSLDEGLQTLRVNLAVLAAAQTRTWRQTHW